MKIAVVILALMFASTPDKKTLEDNAQVTIGIKYSKKISLSKNTSEIAFYFTPKEGIHINTEPLFEFVPEKNSPFDVNGSPRFAKTENGYLDLKKPVEYTISSKAGIDPGQYSLKGKLFYFYCSDSEGWCNRFSQPIDLTIVITK